MGTFASERSSPSKSLMVCVECYMRVVVERSDGQGRTSFFFSLLLIVFFFLLIILEVAYTVLF